MKKKWTSLEEYSVVNWRNKIIHNLYWMEKNRLINLFVNGGICSRHN